MSAASARVLLSIMYSVRKLAARRNGLRSRGRRFVVRMTVMCMVAMLMAVIALHACTGV